ncbi:MAG: serine/threonine protein kinase, partial [Myxococcales bacterium]|nr:serine/threonine protein kinase [Myxococcales bacterium]
KVAIKILRPKTGRSEDAREAAAARLQREAKAMAKLTHPNVVTIHDVGVHEGQVWLAMEFVAGGTLREWVDAGPRPFAEVWPRFRSAGLGLAAAHQAGLVHRDFKPANVLVGSDGRVQVTDFGLARLEGDEDASEPSAIRELGPAARVTSSITLSSRVTQTGAFVGTPAYMAPEQFAGGLADARSDQFAFAVTLWEALCGERPFVADSAHALMFAVLQAKLREPPRTADMSRSVRAALGRALAREPKDRFESMTELLAALEPKQRSRGLVLGVFATLALGLVAGGLWLGGDEPQVAAPTECRGDDPALAAQWNGERRKALKTQLAGLDAPYAKDSAERTVAALDDWAERYRLARVAACEDTHLRGIQSEQLLDQRTLCLDRRVRRMGEVLTVLEAADVDTLGRANTLVDSLDDLDDCANREALTRAGAPPEDPARRKVVADLEAAVDRAQTLRLAGRYEQAVAAAREAMASADEQDHGPTRISSRYELGR